MTDKETSMTPSLPPITSWPKALKGRVYRLAQFLLLVMAVWLSSLNGSFAAGSMDDDIDTDSLLKEAVSLIEQQLYSKALPKLEEVVEEDKKNADAYNYLGFANRKLGNLTIALGHYQKALSLNPDHLGALEYLGELYLELGQLANAEQNLARLQQLCDKGCEELEDLQKAIATFKSKPGAAS
jgi:tetratricopeptide (TPR) repeat protein